MKIKSKFDIQLTKLIFEGDLFCEHDDKLPLFLLELFENEDDSISFGNIKDELFTELSWNRMALYLELLSTEYKLIDTEDEFCTLTDAGKAAKHRDKTLAAYLMSSCPPHHIRKRLNIGFMMSLQNA